MVMPACCWAVINGPFPHTAVTIPVFQTAFETAASAASGIRAGLDVRGDTETTVLAWAGDGGTFDIGLQALSGAAERNENIIYACYDNEAYMNTGIQRSSATPVGAWTTTTPHPFPKSHPKKRMLEIMAAHGIPYIATATIAYPDDMIAKFRRAREIQGTKFIHIFAPCPTGWKSPPEMTIELSRLAVLTRLFPLVEVYDGKRYVVHKDTERRPVSAYLENQGRFRRLGEEQIRGIQRDVDAYWASLLEREGAGTVNG
jgi:pyruvate/2-oxoacid:ferredoxin oxidoreductase beta subunit